MDPAGGAGRGGRGGCVVLFRVHHQGGFLQGPWGGFGIREVVLGMKRASDAVSRRFRCESFGRRRVGARCGGCRICGTVKIGSWDRCV